MSQPDDAHCCNCKHLNFHMEMFGRNPAILPCFKHKPEIKLFPGNMEQATRDSTFYCCDLWVRSWQSRMERIKSWLRR